jgi:preprotein translocase subunit SecG
MSSVGRDRVGTASGINNAVARIAGVLAIAVLGIVMVSAFSSRLNLKLKRVSLPPEIRHEIQANQTKLAGLPVPGGVDPGTGAMIKASVNEAFVFGFRAALGMCAALALTSAALAWFFLDEAGTTPAR